MGLSKIAVKRPITTIMMVLLILIMGFVSFTNLKLNLMPDINPPVLAIMITYPGAGPAEMEEMVTKPIEDIVGTSSGLKGMESRSAANSSLIIAQYDWGRDLTEIRGDLGAQLNQANLPEHAGNPMVMKFDPSMMPILQFAVSTGENIGELQHQVESTVLPEIQTIEGVASVNLIGGVNKEVSILLDKDALQRYNLTQSQVVQIIQGNNIALPGGTLESEGRKLNLRVLGKIQMVETLRELPVSIKMGADGPSVVTLDDIAEVKEEVTEKDSLARTNMAESLLIDVQKEADANTVAVASEIRDRLEELKEQGFTFTIAMDQGDVIESSISNVSSALIYGGIFAILVILAFLRTIRATFIIGIAIPVSVIATFGLMYFMDISLNILSLGGLALGIGMLVDSSIVVLENIYRHIHLGKSRKEAAIDGALEMSGAVTASMLTTISVFLPIVFVGGMIGILFKELALTVVFSLLASWFIALTVVPALSGLLLKVKKKERRKKRSYNGYRSLITWCLKHRIITALITIAIFTGSLFVMPKVGTEYMPAQDEGAFTIDIQLPTGSTASETLAVIEEIEKEALNDPVVEVVTSSIGSGDPVQAAYAGESENNGSLTVKLVDGAERELSTSEFMSTFKKQFDFNENTQMTFAESNQMSAMSGNTNQLELLILSSENGKEKQYVDELSNRFHSIDGITQVTSSLEEKKAELHFIADREEVLKNGLSIAQLAQTISQTIQGQTATTISKNGVETTVMVRLSEPIKTKEELESIRVSSPIGHQVTLSELGEVVEGKGPITIVRQDGKRAVTLKMDFEDVDMGTVSSKVMSVVTEMKDELDINENVTQIKLAGGAEMMTESFEALGLALILAIIFVYMVMASQFESLLHPLIIMFSLPLALTGVVLGLLLSGYAFGVTAFFGIIILAGIVVNNAIVFIDYTNQLRREAGMSKNEALIEAGVVRLKPILMTALTTMLGLLPLAIGAGEGAEIQAPMGVAVIGGLVSSTALTLIVIPVVYSLFVREKRRSRIS